MHQSLCLVLPICLAAAACSEEAPSIPGDENGGAVPIATPVREVQAVATVGPIEYFFSPERLTRSEIQLRLPPEDKGSVWATKLIPAERAAMLGAERCRYGASQQLEMCTAELEEGVALALLERPLGDYRRSFETPGEAGTAVRPAAIAGATGFEYRRTLDGAVMTYSFYPAGERTLLVTKRESEGSGELDPALREVLASLQLPQAD